MMAIFCTLSSCAQQSKSENTKEEESNSKDIVIPMDNQMFLSKVFDYTSGSKEWKYKGDKPAIIDFYATWCGPCRMVAPILKSLAKKYEGQIVVYKVDTDKQKELAGAMGIQSLPTILFIPMSGQPQLIVGAADKATFEKAIQEVLLKKN